MKSVRGGISREYVVTYRESRRWWCYINTTVSLDSGGCCTEIGFDNSDLSVAGPVVHDENWG